MIQDLIPVLDQPVAADGRLIRQQRLHRVEHRRASEISEVLKDVYRDLLSINDRAFASYSSYRPMGYNQTLAATASNPEYQGLISIGSDAEANLLIVSAPGYLADEIIKLAESLDTPADGPAMAVVPAAGDSSDAKAREALSKILRKR
jgi:type II secretory pathway component GspD/PulD (secretin)